VRKAIPHLEAVLTPSGGMTPTATAPVPAAVATTAAPSAWRGRAPVIAGAVALLVVAAVAWSMFGGKASDASDSFGIQQIAVLPFENLGGDTANAYFADGMTDELANALSKVPQLRVASRTSSYAFRDAQARDIAAIRDALKVGALLEDGESLGRPAASRRATGTGRPRRNLVGHIRARRRPCLCRQNELARALSVR
jgi:serine/threonine-protein kinase